MMTDQSQADWQESFVATNLLALGYNAWRGFLTGERGTVVCSLRSPQLSITGESFEVHYVPRSRLAPFLNAWLAAPDTVILNHYHINSHILQAVDRYNPETDAILLLESGDLASFLYLRNLPITPPHGYEIVCQGWEEFYIDTAAFANMRLFQVDLTTPHRRTRGPQRNYLFARSVGFRLRNAVEAALPVDIFDQSAPASPG